MPAARKRRVLLSSLWTSFLTALFVSAPAWAYPSFVAHGYNSCASCHFNPFGGGPLSDYGRAVSATAIAAKPPFIPELSDEVLASYAGVAGATELPKSVRLAAAYRGLYMLRMPEGAEAQKNFITMDAEASLILRPTDKITAVGTIAYVPTPSSASPVQAAQQSNLISREHYIGVRFSRGLGVYAGMMDKVFGLRIQDHESFSRKKTQLSMNDQVHGVAAHFTRGDYEGGVHVFAGNLYQQASLRQSGLSAKIERSFGNSLKAGTSLLLSRGDFVRRQQAAVHAMASLSGERGILAEAGLVHEEPLGQDPKTGGYVFVQGIKRLQRGLEMAATAEIYSKRAFYPEPRSYRLGLGAQYFMLQRLELAAELNGRWTSAGGLKRSVTSYDFLTQVHLIF